MASSWPARSWETSALASVMTLTSTPSRFGAPSQ